MPLYSTRKLLEKRAREERLIAKTAARQEKLRQHAAKKKLAELVKQKGYNQLSERKTDKIKSFLQQLPKRETAQAPPRGIGMRLTPQGQEQRLFSKKRGFSKIPDFLESENKIVFGISLERKKKSSEHDQGHGQGD